MLSVRVCISLAAFVHFSQALISPAFAHEGDSVKEPCYKKIETKALLAKIETEFSWHELREGATQSIRSVFEHPLTDDQFLVVVNHITFFATTRIMVNPAEEIALLNLIGEFRNKRQLSPQHLAQLGYILEAFKRAIDRNSRLYNDQQQRRIPQLVTIISSSNEH